MLSEAERLERRKATTARYRERNRETLRAKGREYANERYASDSEYAQRMRELSTAKRLADPEANRAMQRDSYARHAKKRRAARRGYTLRRYGLDNRALAAMYEAQGRACAICRRVLPLRGSQTAMHIDHDHATGQVRGLLCPECNLGLGKFRDDPALLAAAAAYLKEHDG